MVGGIELVLVEQELHTPFWSGYLSRQGLGSHVMVLDDHGAREGADQPAAVG